MNFLGMWMAFEIVAKSVTIKLLVDMSPIRMPSLLVTLFLTQTIQRKTIADSDGFENSRSITLVLDSNNPLDSSSEPFLKKDSFIIHENSVTISNSLLVRSFENFTDFYWKSSSTTSKFDNDIFICSVKYSEVFALLNKVNSFLEKINNIFTKPRVYIIISSNEQDAMDIFLNSTIGFPIDSEAFLVFYDSKNGRISVWEKLQYKKRTVTVSQLIYLWSYDNDSNFAGLKCSDKISVLQKFFLPSPISFRRENLEWINLGAVAQNDPDYQLRIQTVVHSNGTAEFIAGMCLDILKLMQYLLKFSVTPIDGKGWMGLFPNGTWTGMSGQVVNADNGADLSISQASTIMMADQTHGITFLHPTSSGSLVAIFRQPEPSVIRDVILTPFHPLLWMVYFFAWVILIFCLKAIFFIFRRYDMVSEVDATFTQDESVLWAISTACNIGWYRTPNSRTLRLIFILGVFLAYLLCVGYSASMVMNLATEQLPINNYEDFVASSITIFADKWLPMAHKVLEDMYHERKIVIQNPENYHNQLETIIPSLMNHSWAFVSFPDATSVVFHRLNFSDVFFCQTVYSVVVSKVSYPNAMYIKRGSPLREIFNTRILLLIERGSISRLNKIYDRNTQILCLQKSHAYRGGLMMRDTVAPFLILIGGLMSSLVILIFERKTWNRAKRKKLKLIIRQKMGLIAF